MTRRSSLVLVGAAALTGCFRGEFLQNTCEQQGGCVAPTSTGLDTTTSPPTTSTSASTGTSTSGDSEGSMTSGTSETLPGVPVEGLAFRVDSISIVDPSLYFKLFNCLNVSSFVNDAVKASVESHQTNVLLVAKSYDPDAAVQEFHMFRDADCPPGEDHCLLLEKVLPVKFFSANKDSGNCLDVDFTTINPENGPALNVPRAPCVSSPNASVQLELTPDLSPITFYRGKFSAEYSPGDVDPDALINAIFYGFVPKEDAEKVIFKYRGLEVNFWSVIRGSDHPDACPVPMDGLKGSVSDVDMLDLDDEGPDDPIPGVYLYLNFTGKLVTLRAEV